MSNFISLDQYRAMLERNILAEKSMLVSNLTQPRGQIVFQCPGDNFKMKDVIIPATANAVDLTQQAPLENLLACSQLKALLQLRRVALLNPDDMPETGEGIQRPVLSAEPKGGDLSISGTTVPNATVIVEQNGNVWTSASNGSGVFTVDISGLEEGQFAITVTAEGFTPARFTYEAAPQPLQQLPEPTISGSFKETAVVGTTVPHANIVVNFDDKSFTGQADADGQFSVTVAPLPFTTVEVYFEAEGYLPKTVSFFPASISGVASVNSVEYLSTSVSGEASPNANVEIAVTGQDTVVAVADSSGVWTADVMPIKGDINVRSLEVDGYAEASTSMTPTKRHFGAITIDGADEFGEKRTKVSGSIEGLSKDATDISVIVTLQAGLYEGNVNLEAGTFEIDGVDATAGVGSPGVVTIESSFYEPGSQSFEILEEFAAVEISAATDGDTSVSGTTSAMTKVTITMAGETKSASSDIQGAFSVDGFTNVVPGEIAIVLERQGYLTTTQKPVLIVSAFGEISGVLTAGDTSVAGHATPGSIVAVTQDSVSGDANADDTTGAFSVTLSAPLVEGQVQFAVTHAGYSEYKETVSVSGAPAPEESEA